MFRSYWPSSGIKYMILKPKIKRASTPHDTQNARKRTLVWSNRDTNCPFTWTHSKVKFHSITGHERPEGEKMYSCTLSLTSGPDGGWVVNATPRLLYTPGKTRYPLYRRLGRPQGRSRRVRKILPPPGFIYIYILKQYLIYRKHCYMFRCIYFTEC
jgi:hypothetical protein